MDDGFWSHPKTLQLSPTAVALWVRAGSWSCQQLTDGVVPTYTLPMFGADEDSAVELVGVGYWHEVDGGYEFHDWDDYQEASEQVKERRKKNAEKMRRWREAKAEKGVRNEVSDEVTNQVTNPVSNALPDPTRPDPTSSSTKKGSTRQRASTISPKFEITEAMRSWAKDNTPHVDIDAKLPEFIDYWTGTGRVMKDWVATWRNGMRKQEEFALKDIARTQPAERPKRRQFGPVE